MADSVQTTRDNAFKRLIAPIKEWAATLKATDTKPNKEIDGVELSTWAAKEAIANPSWNLTEQKLQDYAARAITMREELDAALTNADSRDPRALLLRSIARNNERSPRSEFAMRDDLQRFMLEAKPTPADGSKKLLTPEEIDQSRAITREIAQGMVALNGVQSIIGQSTRKLSNTLRENREQLPFAESALKTEQADEARIDAAVKAAKDSRLTPEQMLKSIRDQAAASGQVIPPHAQAALERIIPQIMNAQGQSQTPEEEAAAYRAAKTGYTKEQHADIVEARKTIGGYTLAKEPTLRDFKAAMDAMAQAPRGR